jgi:hypothetical protein
VIEIRILSSTDTAVLTNTAPGVFRMRPDGSAEHEKRKLHRVCIIALLVTALACSEQTTIRYESVAEARAHRLFERGWFPDVLPAESGPIVERHDIDTNARCARAEFPAASMDTVVAALISLGFARDVRPAPGPALRSCPFQASELRSLRIRLGRPNSDAGDYEYAALTPGGSLLYWSITDSSGVFMSPPPGQ